MASELSRLIDDELEKVGRQEKDTSGNKESSSFRIKGPEKPPEPTWRNWAWWTRGRLIAAGIAGLLLVLVLLLLVPKSSSSSVSDTLANFGSHSGAKGAAAPLEAFGGSLAPTLSVNSSNATTASGSIQNSVAPAPAQAHAAGAPQPSVLSAPSPSADSQVLTPGPSQEGLSLPLSPGESETPSASSAAPGPSEHAANSSPPVSPVSVGSLGSDNNRGRKLGAITARKKS